MKFTGRILVAVLMLVISAPTYAGNVPQLSVRGEATIEVPANRTLVEIGVGTDADNAKRAMEENSEIMIRVISALEEVGLADDEYETGQLQLRPRWHSVAGEEPATIIGYRASNRVRIKTTNQALVGKLILVATDAGANDIGRLSFDLSNPRKYRSEAIAKATENAFSDARALAAAADMRIVQVTELRLDNATLPRPMTMAVEAFSSKRAAPPIKPGDVSLRAAVTLVCEIAPNR